MEKRLGKFWDHPERSTRLSMRRERQMELKKHSLLDNFITKWVMRQFRLYETLSSMVWSLVYVSNTLPLEDLSFVSLASMQRQYTSWYLSYVKETVQLSLVEKSILTCGENLQWFLKEGRVICVHNYIDNKTQLTHIYFFWTEDEQPNAYKKYEAWTNTQMGVKIKILNMDRGGKYLGADFVEYLKSKGTIQKLSIHDTHQESGVAKWQNCTVIKCTRALPHTSGLPKYLWAEAAHHALWLLNWMITKAVDGMTPFEAAFGKKSIFNIYGLQEWGGRVLVCI